MKPEFDTARHEWFDPSGFPIVFVRFPPNPTEEWIADFHRTYDAFFTGPGRNKPYVAIADLTHLLGATSRQRKIVADHEKQWADYDERYCVGAAIVCTNALTRGIITALYWLSPPKYVYQVFSTVDEARAWVKERLKQVGIAV